MGIILLHSLHKLYAAHMHGVRAHNLPTYFVAMCLQVCNGDADVYVKGWVKG